MQLRIIHQTRYDYSPPVVMAQHLAHLTPLNVPGQTVLAHRLEVSPDTVTPLHTPDAFGNQRCFFTVQTPHAHLSVTADSLVSTTPPQPLPDSPAWDDVRKHLTYRAGAVYDPAIEFTFASPFVPRSTLFADFADALFSPGEPLLECAQALMTHIHTSMTYEGGSTAIDTPALDALAQRKGVCQDFAHIMIGCLRSLGLPARYVSGYMLTQPPPGKPRLIGADASHAWVQVYCPTLPGTTWPDWPGSDADSQPSASETPAGIWVDFDPTNNHCGWGRPTQDYVTLAIGRDFGDVSPLRGVIQGGGNPMLTVSVTVAPPAELASLSGS